MIFAAYLLSTLGFACLALSLPKHWRDIFAMNLEPSLKWVLRIAGWGLLAAALVLCIVRWHAAIGIFAWAGTLTVSALLIALLLAYGRVRQ